MATSLSHRVRRHGYRIKQQFRRDPFSTIVLYSILLSIFFIVFAFRGMIFTMFVKPVGVINPALEQLRGDEPAPVDATKDGQTDEAVIFKSSGTYTVESGDTLSSIAAELGIDWKELAELNNVQPPYSLSVGTELKLP